MFGFAAFALSSSVARADFIDHFATSADVGLLKVPHLGETRVLVIPLIIDDLPFSQGSETNFLAETTAFFDPEAEGWAFTPYWVTSSLGRYRPIATVAAPVRFASCPPIGDYQDCAIPRGGGISEGNLQAAAATLRGSLYFLDQVLKCAQTGPGAGVDCTEGGGVDLAAFDVTGVVPGTPDGFVDGVIVVSNGSFPGITLPAQELSENALFNLLGPLPSFIYGSETVGAIAVAGRVDAPNREVWVAVHEFGHALGFADLYNEAGTTTDMPYTVMGGWYYDNAAPLLDPFSRLAIGFGHALQVTGDGTFELGPVDRTGTVLKVGTGEEFFVVELRRKIPGVLDDDLHVDAGVIVERVRLQKRPSPERGNYLNTLQECVNCAAYDSFLSIEQADGLFQLERGFGTDDEDDLFFPGDEIGPSDDVLPRSATHAVFSTNLMDGTPTSITIRVTELSAESATVEIQAPPVADACAEIAPYCGDLPCEDGECGRVIPVEEPPPPECDGCCCGSARGTATGAAVWAVAWCLIAVLRRRPVCRTSERCVAPAARLPSVE
ncbi:MAG: hypothetical protein A2138_20160 [Deltaproteobacteria bacterium RBG_16_71_12]|nr:MAG: hypothetical protein A2138_20160 [Deltaproteobacteria bacterium RBG_16_71_12]